MCYILFAHWYSPLSIPQDLGPSWLLYNLAGLYWRVVGNSQNGLECLRRSLFHCPRQFRDVPLVNLANVLYKWGRVDDAVSVVMDALDVNDLEVSVTVLTYTDSVIVEIKTKCIHARVKCVL